MTKFSKGTTTILAAVFLVLFTIQEVARADVVILKSGKELEGKIEEEWDTFIKLNMGSSVITVQRDTITTIVKSLYAEGIVQQARESLEKGRKYMNDGRMFEARRFYEIEILRLEQVLNAHPNAPEDILKIKAVLEEARRETFPPDPKSRELEDIYQKALNALDRVRYEEAFQLLKQANQLSPERTDILMKLGLVARQMKQYDEAIRAFQTVLEKDAENYYNEVSPVLLDLLDKRGKELLTEKKYEEALARYRTFLLLRSEIPQKPIDMRIFRERYNLYQSQNEEENLARIFIFAEEQDLMGLSLAVARRMREMKPEDDRIRKLVSETEFLVEFRDIVEKGGIARAARLKIEMSPDILKSERVYPRIERLVEGINPQDRARFIFLEARNIFQKGRFEESRNLYQRLLKEFPASPQASEAMEDLKNAEMEVPVERAMRTIREFLDAGNVERAEMELRELLRREGVEKSLQWKDIQDSSLMLEKEMNARKLWIKAEAGYKTRRFDDLLEMMQDIERNYADTFTGKKAIRYLEKNSENIRKKIEEQRIIEKEIFLDLRDLAVREFPEKTSPEQKKTALAGFEAMMKKDLSIREGVAVPRLLWILALAIGSIFCIAIILKLTPPGSEILKKKILIHEWEQGFVQKGDDLIFEDSQCRFCGLEMNEGADICHHCGASIRIHEEELSRNRFNDFYGAGGSEEDITLREKELEDHFKVAEELADAGNTKAAFKMALMAYHDDPRQMKCLELLAALYEKMKKPQEAYLCYHRMIMLDPTNQDALHKTENFKSVLSSVPIRAKSLISVLSLAFWWMVFWLAMGLDPWGWAFLYRLGLCFTGFVLTTLLWNYQLKRGFILPEERGGPSLSFYHRLCRRNLHWKDLNQLSEIIQKIIFNHAGVRVPKLSTGSLILYLFLSLIFLCSLILIGRLSRYPAILFSWIGGFILLFFLAEIHPRIMIAHVLLRHFYEELQSTWADPEIPFKTHRLEAGEEGEFNTKNPGPLPVSWAWNPSPYKATRQGFLNSIMQTLNRHAGFHCFYKNLKIENPFRIAWPSGFGRLKILTLSVVAFSLIAAPFLFYRAEERNADYQRNAQIGYQRLLDQKDTSAMEYFSNARRIDPRGFASDLYMGMAFANTNLHRLANKSFLSAARKGAEVAAVHEQYAEYLRNRGMLNEAVREYKQALEAEPRNANILNNIGMTYFNMSNYSYCITYLTQSVAFDPQNGRAYTVLGMAYEETGDKIKSREAFEKAIKVAPQASLVKLAQGRLQEDGVAAIQIPE
ncbi:tetratricopeptide repeat protein [Candidatus Sumerlaeota bacterium]|nr:tetratricopeptide repeat protein [Candidatus Sumerlaeota bacterium]